MLNFNRPLGLDPITDYIDNLCPMEADDCHYIIHMDAGSGQSTLTEYMSDIFYRNRIRHFGGRERFLEYRLDGSLSQLRQVLEDIDANACYTNHFEGIIALDIAGLAHFVNQTQTEVFLKALPELGKHATMVFFTPTVPKRNLDRLIARVQEVLGDVMVFRPAPYNAEHLTGIILHALDEYGIVLDCSEELYDCIMDLVRSTGTGTVREAHQLARKLGRCADRTGLRPTLSAEDLLIITEETTPTKKKEAM